MKREFPLNERKFIKTKEMIESGLSYYKINRLVKNGLLKKINGNTYENVHYVGDESDYLYVGGYVSFGVVCLMSSALYHGISTHRPHQMDVAIPIKSHAGPLPEWPTIGIYYFSKKRYEIGVETVEYEGGSFKIYDKEKTICDLLFYRKRIGVDSCLDVLKRYFKEKDKDMNRLVRYAKDLRVLKILSLYMEALS